MSRRATVAALVALAALILTPAVRADADPASDVLLEANVFYPYSPAVSPTLQAALNAEVAAAHKARLPIKVALIANPTDLGAIPELFDKPRQYAPFLDQEITFAVKAPVLVVMPDGEGTAGLPRRADAAAVALPAPAARDSNALAQAAISAVRKLAAAAGHPLGRVSVPTQASTDGGTGTTIPLAIMIVVCAGLAGGILAFRRRRAQAPAARRS